jgi:predicted kinase
MSLTYSEVFEDHMPEAVFSMLSDIKRARSERNNIVWDQTSVSRVSRARKINMLPEYDIIGILFPTPSPKELRARLDSRPGKQIPESVIEQMLRSFELPTLDEGFTNIIDFTHRMENIDGLC